MNIIRFGRSSREIQPVYIQEPSQHLKSFNKLHHLIGIDITSKCGVGLVIEIWMPISPINTQSSANAIFPHHTSLTLGTALALLESVVDIDSQGENSGERSEPGPRRLRRGAPLHRPEFLLFLLFCRILRSDFGR